jgi:hypothetical protein
MTRRTKDWDHRQRIRFVRGNFAWPDSTSVRTKLLLPQVSYLYVDSDTITITLLAVTKCVRVASPIRRFLIP